ncbi:MAG: hypothetical protein AAF352_05905, partial [Pseudomonadota bacterium]
MTKKVPVFMRLHKTGDFSLDCIRYWRYVFATDLYEILILCDLEIEAANLIIEEVGLPKNCLLPSVHLRPIMYANLYLTDDKSQLDIWARIGATHMAAFQFAKMMGYDEFWDIDSDVLCFTNKPQRIRYGLEEARAYAQHHAIDLFSVDVHLSKADCWGFGVTYCNTARVNFFYLLFNLKKQDHITYRKEYFDRPIVSPEDLMRRCTKVNNDAAAEQFTLNSLPISIDILLGAMAAQGLFVARSFYFNRTKLTHIANEQLTAAGHYKFFWHDD